MAYMTGFKIVDHPRIKPLSFSMDFGDRDFLNLIITGRNGTGKSTLLTALWNSLLEGASSRLNRTYFKITTNEKEDRLVAFLKDQHLLNYTEQPGQVPNKVDFVSLGKRRDKISYQFVPFLKHQFLQMLLSKANGDQERSTNLERWLQGLSSDLGSLFEIDGLKMRFDSATYVLTFEEPNGTSYDFSQLSAGFSAVLDMIGELIMRINVVGTDRDAMNVTGITLIDEIDAHLHPRIQEKILPFLTHMFPRIQFVVATHSPAVIGSISNATVFDLDRLESCPSKEYIGTPYGQVMTSHFGLETDFGDETTTQLKEAKSLIEKEPLTPQEEKRLWTILQSLRKTQHPMIMQAYAKQLEKQLAEEGAVDDKN